MAVCAGSFRALLLYNIAEEIDLGAVRRALGAELPVRSPGFRLPAPGYVRFERPPVMEPCEPIRLATGENAEASIRHFDYGLVCLEIGFQSDWPALLALSNRWIEAGEVEQRGLKNGARARSKVAAGIDGTVSGMAG